MTVVIIVDLSIESVTLDTTPSLGDVTTSGDGDDLEERVSAAQRLAYIGAVRDFRRLVLADFDLVLTAVRDDLTRNYGCRAVRVGDGDGVVRLELVQPPRSKLVALQCDHSSGHLCRQLQRQLVTDAVVDRLGVGGLTLAVDVETRSSSSADFY